MTLQFFDMSKERNFGKKVEIEVPRVAISIVLDRADFDAYCLKEQPDIDEETVEEVNQAIKVVREALEEGELVNFDPTTQSTLPTTKEDSG